MTTAEFKQIMSNIPVYVPLFVLKRLPKWVVEQGLDLRPGEYVVMLDHDTAVPVRDGKCLPNKYSIGHSKLAFIGYFRQVDSGGISLGKRGRDFHLSK